MPWESLRVSAAGEPTHVTSLGVLHGTGIAAAAGSTLTLLLVGHRLARPGHSVARDIAVAAAGTLLALGTALFTMSGGYRPAETQTYAVTLGPGLVLCALSGVALLAVAVLSVHRTPATSSSGKTCGS